MKRTGTYGIFPPPPIVTKMQLTAIMGAFVIGVAAVAFSISADREYRDKMPEPGRFFPSWLGVPTTRGGPDFLGVPARSDPLALGGVMKRTVAFSISADREYRDKMPEPGRFFPSR
jgi:hypothetical protein